jgi:Cu/Ag efflux pump CusA
MNLVSFALRRPISLLTMVVAAALLGFLALDRMSRDIFPDLGVPVLYVAQPYGGLDPAQMEGFIVNYYEYHFLYITARKRVSTSRASRPAPHWPHRCDRQLRRSQARRNHRRSIGLRAGLLLLV